MMATLTNYGVQQLMQAQGSQHKLKRRHSLTDVEAAHVGAALLELVKLGEMSRRGLEACMQHLGLTVTGERNALAWLSHHITQSQADGMWV